MKVQAHLDPVSRKKIRQHISKYPHFHDAVKRIHRIYCKLTGNFHVLPDFYIIGTEKGGTSSLYGYLVQHPDIYSAVTKEINFFGRYYLRGINWYKVNFPSKFQKFFREKILRKKFLTGEASVRYLDHPHAAYRIKETTPNAKFIILLRNPVNRAYSQHSMIVRGGHENLSFEEAVEKESIRTKVEFEKMKKDPSYYSNSFFRYSYLSRGIYVNSLKLWMSIFPKENFLILNSEEFFKNPSKIFNRTLDFLNVKNIDLDEYKVFRAQNKNPPMNQTLREKLEQFFIPHNQKLYDFLKIDFGWERFDNIQDKRIQRFQEEISYS